MNFSGSIRLDIFTLKHFTFQHSSINGSRFCNVSTDRATVSYLFKMKEDAYTGRYEILNPVPSWIKVLEQKLSDVINRHVFK